MPQAAGNSDNALIAVQRVIIPLIPRAGSINGLNKND